MGNNFWENLFYQSGDFLNILGMIGIASLIVLTPIAILIYKDVNEFEILDRNVILDGVIDAKFFIHDLIFIFLPLVLWNNSSVGWKVLELLVWGIGTYRMFERLYLAYCWVKGNKFKRRFEYLKNLKDFGEIEESWRSVWETKKINTENEKEFFLIFRTTIDSLIEKK